KGISPSPVDLLGLAEGAAASTSPDAASLLEARGRNLAPSLSVSYRAPVPVHRGFMTRLYDRDGQAYLDTVNNVAHVGHAHPRVVEAVSKQLRVLNTNTRYLYEELHRFAERLTATLPDALDACFFVNSGSEANDLALRLARSHTRRTDVLVHQHAYHGNLSSLIEISPYKFAGEGGAGRRPHVHVAPMPDPYRSDASGAAHAEALRRAAGKASDGLAAFVAESAMGCGGQVFYPDGYLAAAYRHARRAGAACIADEVQTGFGRVGEAFWAFELQDVVPDIVTMGKPIGNGHPLGAVVTTRAIAASFDSGMEYFNTFGGNPVSCAAGLAVLDVIR
ncbi:MAG: aminotransferase class III-fold pyridoxal phosphate-dependent enzyme, partial [Rhodothermales bacterium]